MTLNFLMVLYINLLPLQIQTSIYVKQYNTYFTPCYVPYVYFYIDRKHINLIHIQKHTYICTFKDALHLYYIIVLEHFYPIFLNET